MSIVILCGIYLAELACYQLGIRILFEARQKTKLWMMIGILFPVVIGCLPVDEVGKSLIVIVFSFSIMLISMDGKLIENGVQLVLITILLECVDNMYKYPCEQMMMFLGNVYYKNAVFFEQKCCTILSAIIFLLLKERVKINKNTHINSLIYIILGIIAASMMFCLSILNRLRDYLPNEKFIALCKILNISIYISIILLVIFIIYIKKTHERMEQLLKTEKLLKEAQVSYYKQALKKEADTRRYRHDMIGHLGYIRDILSENKIEEAKQYLNSILGRFNKLLSSYYVTGNDMVDTIMNHLFSMLPDDVEIIIKNRIPIKFDIEDTEVCTIFSNIFQNIVEEVKENCIKSARVIIVIQKGRDFAEYIIKNTLSKQIDEKHIDKNGLPKSHKDDKCNHGIGMINVKEAVERNRGNFIWYQDDGYFCVKIILPII